MIGGISGFAVLITLLALALWLASRYDPQTMNFPYSTVLVARDGSLLSAITASDGQWRFPPFHRTIPQRIKYATLIQEDRRFYWHPGIDPIAVLRALYVNLRTGKIKQGASTITMQLARILRDNPPRTLKHKIIEALLALGLELKYSKEDILRWYLSLAPYGGNVVGIEAASWRYFGKPVEHLTWAESATLALLPHSPSLINLRRNRTRLLQARNRLLQQLFLQGYMDSIEYHLSLHEPLPSAPHPVPNHLIQLHPYLRTYIGNQPSIIETTIDPALQKKVEALAQIHYMTRLLPNGIHNLAVVVVDLHTAEVLASLPNIPLTHHSTIATPPQTAWVDMLHARRNPGSLLKPILYACALTEGLILPSSLLPDYPFSIHGYAPQNFSGQYQGAVPAWQALAHSLNVPAVLLLYRYGVEKFHFVLRQLGFSSLQHPPSHYGLSLILGTFEVSLWEVVSVYYSLIRYLRSATQGAGHQPVYVYQEPCLVKPCPSQRQASNQVWHSAVRYLSPGALWITLNMLLKAERPAEEQGWQFWLSDFPVAWKTGTSSGLRDAWAIGITADYLVGVWVGNATGEGRPQLTGFHKAAPLLFDILRSLDQQFGNGFPEPIVWLQSVKVCAESGMRASSACPAVREEKVPIHTAQILPACTYHRRILLSEDRKWRVYRNCYTGTPIDTVWYVLPPAMATYFKKRNPTYMEPPPLLATCRTQGLTQEQPMAIVSPRGTQPIYLPGDHSEQALIVRAVHRYADAVIYWFLDDHYLGKTSYPAHILTLMPDTGIHHLVLIDNYGNVLRRRIRILAQPGTILNK